MLYHRACAHACTGLLKCLCFRNQAPRLCFSPTPPPSPVPVDLALQRLAEELYAVLQR